LKRTSVNRFNEFSISTREALLLFFELPAASRKLRSVDLPPLVRVAPI